MTGLQLVEVACPSCSAPVQHLTGAAFTQCPYCEATLTTARESRPTQAPAGTLAPFTVSVEDFRRTLLEWLVQGEYTPDDLLQQMLVRDHTGIYVAFYEFSGSYRADWNASAGYRRRESYTDTQSRFHDGEWLQESVLRQRTVTDWQPASGVARDEFQVLCAAGKLVEGPLAGFCEVRAAGSAGEPLETAHQHIDGYLLEAPRPAEECFEQRGRAQLDQVVRQKVLSRIPGDTSRDEKWDLEITGLNHRVFYRPFWLASYTYDSTHYEFILDGRDITRFRGNRPVDKQRKQRIAALYKGVNKWGLVWLIIGIVGAPLFLIPSLIALAIGLPFYLRWTAQADREKAEVFNASRAVRQRAMQAIRDGGGLQFSDNASTID